MNLCKHNPDNYKLRDILEANNCLYLLINKQKPIHSVLIAVHENDEETITLRTLVISQEKFVLIKHEFHSLEKTAPLLKGEILPYSLSINQLISIFPELHIHDSKDKISFIEEYFD